MSAAPGRRLRAIAVVTSIAVWLVYITTAGGMMATGDAVAMFDAAKSLVDRGAIDVPPGQSSELWRGVDGRYYTPFGIGQSLFDVPFLLAGRAATRVIGPRLGDPDTIPKAFVAAASTIPAAVAVAFALLLAWRLSSDARSSVLAALVLAFGTMLWPYAKFGFNAALTAGALTAGVYGLAAGAIDRRAWVAAGGGAAVGVALLTRHEMILAAAAGLGWFLWQVRQNGSGSRLAIAAAIPVCVAFGLWMTLNMMRFGSPWHTGHAPGFAWSGFGAFLVSPSGALLLYSPPALAGLALVATARNGQPISWLMMLVVAVLVVFYATLQDWLGTRSYGPRYLVPLLPLLVAPMAVWFARARRHGGRSAWVVLCLAGVAVQLPAIAVDFSRAGIEAGQPPQASRRDEWQWAPLVVNTRAILPAARSSARALMLNAPQASGPAPAGVSLSSRLPLGLDFWWMHLFQLGALPRATAVLAGLLPLVAAVWLVRIALARASLVDREARRQVSG
jgi:hypothetical protein